MSKPPSNQYIRFISKRWADPPVQATLSVVYTFLISDVNTELEEAKEAEEE
jgi:hypothetical protein